MQTVMSSSSKILGLSLAGLAMNSATCFAATLWTTADYGDTTTAPATQGHNITGDVYYNTNLPIVKNMILCLIMVIILMWMGSVGCRVADALERSWIRKEEAAIKKPRGQRPSTTEDQMEAQVSEQEEEDGVSGQDSKSPG